MFEPLTQADYEFDERAEEARNSDGGRYQGFLPASTLDYMCQRLREQGERMKNYPPKLNEMDKAVLRARGEL